MDASHTPLIILLVVLLGCSALASASETALFGITHGQRANLRRANPRLSRIIESLLAKPRELLMQVLLLNMMVNVSYFIVTSILTIRSEGALTRVLISVISITTIILIGEVFAKLFASSATVLFLRFAAPIHLIIRQAIVPVLRFLDRWVIAPMSRLYEPSKSSDPVRAVSAEQMGTLISLSANDGVIDPGEQELLTSIVKMGQMRVEQVMTPRVDLHWIQPGISNEDLVELCQKTGRNRFLVCKDGIDSGILGVVNARKILEGEPIEKAMNEVLYIPEQGRLDRLIDQFRNTGHSVAICVDEHGGVSGIITISDVANELIDGVSDPKTSPADEVEMIGVGRWIVPGRLSIRDWAMMFADQSVIDHAKRVNTLGGLVMVLLDQVPEVGDFADIGDIRLTVLQMDERSIDRIEVQIRPTEKPLWHQDERSAQRDDGGDT